MVELLEIVYGSIKMTVHVDKSGVYALVHISRDNEETHHLGLSRALLDERMSEYRLAEFERRLEVFRRQQ